MTQQSRHWRFDRITRLVGSLAFVASAVFISAAMPRAASATHCTNAPFQATGNFFASYEAVEYQNGLLVIHLKIKSGASNGSQWFSGVQAFTDDCELGTVESFPGDVTIPAGVYSFSIRFASTTHLDIWNDETETKISCSGCSRNITAFPGYYEVRFVGAQSAISFVRSSTHRIRENAPDPPVRVDTLPTPAGCPNFQASGYFFDNYEKAEYVNGLLAYHFRFKPPRNDGRSWISRLAFFNAACGLAGANPINTNTNISGFSRYYSVRFSSPTHYDIWNDETNQKEGCPACSVDIPATLPGGAPYTYVTFRGFTDFLSFFDSTPFPVVEATTPSCCSNVAFLPGIQSSRLYKKQILENKLWEPNKNADAVKLYLNENGAPIDPSIYTKDIIDEAFGFNIYKGFSDFMDNISGDEKTIAEWKALPYDWRMAVSDVPNEFLKLADGETYRMVDEIRELAETSRTGKVTIIAHSNGGLIAEMLFEKLKNEGDPLLQKIDKLILVAAPQLGTPKAIAGLLHGDEQTLAKGIILNKATARGLAENMPSAYTLLPSEKYFERVYDPVIEFDPDTANIPELSGLAGTSISSKPGLNDFITGHKGAWSEPPETDTDTPNVLKPGLLSAATSTQTVLDSWAPPTGTEVIQIAGWGLDTIRGIRYDDCDAPFCSDTLSHLDRSLLLTQDGDGTVVVPSAVAINGVEDYYVNLPKHNFLVKRNRSHASILETEEIQEFISNVIQGNRDLPANISSTKPLVSNEADRLRFRIHSPVALHLYDTEENHTGVATNSDPASDLRLYEEHIPNSYYAEFGETKYAGADTSATTTVRLIGEALGTFAFEIDEVLGEQVAANTAWSDIPVTASSTLTMDIRTLSTANPLLMDVDGDGIIDTPIAPGEGVSSQELLPILRGIIKTLNLPDRNKATLIKAVDKLEKALDKEYKNEHAKKVRLEKAFDDLTRKIRKLEKKGILTGEETEQLVRIIEQIEGDVIG